MFGAGQQSSSTAQPAGVSIAVEAGYEWKIQEIGFDGVEKYMRCAIPSKLFVRCHSS